MSAVTDGSWLLAAAKLAKEAAKHKAAVDALSTKVTAMVYWDFS